MLLNLEGKVEAHGLLKFKQKRIGHKKPVMEGESGASWSHKLRRFIRRVRRIDRAGNLYTETVTDPLTGDAIHECEEPLTDHQGHGSAKLRSGGGPEE